MLAFAQWIYDFCDGAIDGGYVVAMVVICLLQYAYHLYRARRAAQLKEQLYHQIDDIQKDLRTVSRDRTLASLENQILREFTGELDLDRTIDQLVRRLVSETKDGFAAYISLGGSSPRVVHSRGLSDRARKSLVIDPGYIERVAQEGVIMFRKAEMYSSQLLDSLSPGERSRFDRLFLAGLGDRGHLTGVIVTTSLLPSGTPLDQQMELARRLMQSLSGIVRRSEELEDRDRQLQSINEIMELRAVTDRKHTSPLDMVEAFVDRLREMAGAERAVLFLVTPEAKESYKPLCRCGLPLSKGVVKKHADYELLLAETAVARRVPETFDGPQLARIGVQSMIGSAIVAPVLSQNGIAGALCLTRTQKSPFTIGPELLTWAAHYLSETLLRALHQTVAEWHARQDPLTDLSNRRTFDRELAAALQTANADDGRCALMMIDIDRFKTVNDRFGHLTGDEVLRSVSRALKALAPRSRAGSAGMAARFGGEEFAILLPGVDSEEAAWIGETVRSTIEVTPIQTQQGEIQVTVSVGVSAFPEHGRTPEDLLAGADAALYQAKESGRNRVLIAPAVQAS